MLVTKPILGLLQGLIVYGLFTFYPYNESTMMGLLVFFTFPLFALQIKLPGKKEWLLGLTVLSAMAVAYGFVSYQLTRSLHMSTADIVPALMAQSAISGFIFFIFYCALIEEGRFRFPYSTLFSESWQVILKIFLGQILAYLTLGLCWLAALLFQLLNISLVYDIVLSDPFVYVMPPLFFGMAMVVLHQYETIITTFRNILLAFCKFLYPILVVISFVFLLIVPFASQSFIDFWPVIILLSALNLILFNGLFQGGLKQPPYAKWLCILVYGTIVLNSFYSLYILKFPWQAISHFDVLSLELLALINLIMLALYNLGYTLAIFFSRKSWLSLVKWVNTFLALTLAGVYLILALFGNLWL